MKFLKNLFKKKPKKEKETKKAPEPIRKEEKPKVVEPVKKPAVRQKITGIGPRILHSPHIAEKPSWLAEKDQYVFKVFAKANKNQIKKAVEETYNVDIEAVKIISVSRKKRRVGRIQGWRKGYKKAVVKVKKGQKIEIMPR